MIDITIFILSFSIIILFSALIGRYFYQYLKFRTELNTYFFIFFLSFGIGIILDSLWTITFYVFGGFVDPFIDKFIFIIKSVFIYVGISVIFKIIIILNNQSGHPMKNELIYRHIYLFAIVIITILNVFTSYEIDFFDSNMTIYQSHYVSMIFTFILYIPLFFIIIKRTRIFMKIIKDEKLKMHINVIAIIFASLSASSILFIGYHSINILFFNNQLFLLQSIVNVLSRSITFFVISLLTLVLTLKNSHFLELTSIYFCIKTVYLVRNNGEMMYEYDIHENERNNSINSQMLLLGGFIYSLSSGLKELLKVKDVNSIDVGDMKLIIKHGRHIFGILFVTENTPLLHNKLEKFVNRFEDRYEENLENWTGCLTIFECDEINKWIDDIFRRML